MTVVRSIQIVTSASLLLAVPRVALRAQLQEQPLVRVGFAGGVVVPTADARNALKNGVQGQKASYCSMSRAFRCG